MNNRNYSGLTSVGSEIVSSNIPTQRNILFSAGKRPKLIVKSYKITNDTSIPDIKSNKQEMKQSSSNTNIKSFTNNNNNNINDISKSKENKSVLNLSNIKYKDGYILKDAANSNPGYGLWAIKTPNEEIAKKEQINLEESKNLNLIKFN